jgi:Protein of unknown function (DUF1552)/Protein of unknown function (DUF1501)
VTRSRTTRLDRRSFLTITGGLAAAATLGSRASAQAAQPKRLIIVFCPDGTIPAAWRPTGSQTDFMLGPILAPLQPYRSDMLILDGVRRMTRGAGDGHEQGMTQILTGRPNLSGATRSSGPSLDEFVNARIGEGRQPLRLGVLSKSNATNWTRMTFGESGNVVHPENSPYKARDVLFSGFTPPGTGPTPAEIRRQAIRKAAVAYAKNHAGRLAATSSEISRRDLEAHVRALTGLQTEPPPPPTAQCTLDRINAWTAGIDVNANDNFPKVVQMQMELISAAFACDRARVAVLQCAMSNSEVYWKWVPGGGANSEHHGLSHYEFGNVDPARTNVLTAVYKWHAEQIAWLVGDLKAKGLFDNTVILWTSEMGEGKDHSPDNIPMVILGGAGHFKTGQWVDYRNKSGAFIPGTTGVSHCDVLTSVCNAMGIQTDTFGEAANCHGPLKGVT